MLWFCCCCWSNGKINKNLIWVAVSCWRWRTTASTAFMKHWNSVPSFPNRLVESVWISTASEELVATSPGQTESPTDWSPCSESSTTLLAMSIKEEIRCTAIPFLRSKYLQDSMLGRVKSPGDLHIIEIWSTFLYWIFSDLTATRSVCRVFGAVALRRIRIPRSEEEHGKGRKSCSRPVLRPLDPRFIHASSGDWRRLVSYVSPWMSRSLRLLGRGIRGFIRKVCL